MTLRSSKHNILVGAAHKEMGKLDATSVQLVVTSPPYPMIEMWDEIMANQNADIANAQKDGNGALSFELMHQELDKIWEQVERVLCPGGFACVNIGDATRTISENFALYNNHSRIISTFIKLGFSNMPNIIWRKQTNAPNKFMGSGMLPAGAYVTLEHEWILIFRKGGKRVFKTDADKQLRRESAFFWEERNTWFSDVWDLKGTKQKIEDSETRSRSAAYPFELPYRLINMFSVKGDTIVDPFLGTGTSTIAAMIAERNSIGVEIDHSFLEIIDQSINHAIPNRLNDYLLNRINNHKEFIFNRSEDLTKNEIKHHNISLGLPVMTSQETGIKFSYIDKCTRVSNVEYEVLYKEIAKQEDILIKRRSHVYQEALNF
jgi:DNA modification methylase